MVTTTRHPKYAVYNGQGARRQNRKDNATAENSFRGAKGHMGRMVDDVEFGWMVQVVGQRSDANGTAVLMVRSGIETSSIVMATST